MNIKKLVIDITKDRIKVAINGEEVSGIQKLDLTINSEPSPEATGIIKAWKKVGSSDMLKLGEMTNQYTSCFGPYITPLTNNLNLETEAISILEDPTGEFADD